MKITDKKAQEILENSEDTELWEMYNELFMGDECILEVDDYLENEVTNSLDNLKNFIRLAQENSNLNLYNEYILVATYDSDYRTSDDVKSLLTDEDWVMVIQDYYEYIDEDDED